MLALLAMLERVGTSDLDTVEATARRALSVAKLGAKGRVDIVREALRQGISA